MKSKLTFGLLILVATIAAFLFVIAGGLDKFREPVKIVLPSGFNGLLCIELREEAGTQSGSQFHYADSHGRLAMESSIAQSHRRRLLYWRTESAKELLEIPQTQWTQVLTERDSSTGQHFSVYWIGSSGEWNEVSRKSEGRPLCGR